MKLPHAALLLTVAALSAPAAEARPVYAIQEGKQCIYCHVSPRGGGARNPRGDYYAAHKHTFEGYDEAKVMALYSPSLFKLAWKETLPETARRVGIGDTADDGVNRLVLLSEGASKDQRTVSVRKWDGKSWVTEYTTDAAAGQDRLAVGKFAGMGPAMVVTSDSLVFWNGKSYEKRPSPHPLAVLGTVRLRDGSERLLLREGTGMKMYRVDTSATGSGWLTGSTDPPDSTQTSFSEMKGRTEELASIGMPDALAAGGIVGLWNARANSLYLYAVQIIALVEDKQGTAADQIGKTSKDLVLKGHEDHLTVVDPRLTAYKTLWQSERLSGDVMDVALGDPRATGRGLTALTNGSSDSKGHTLYFFQLD